MFWNYLCFNMTTAIKRNHTFSLGKKNVKMYSIMKEFWRIVYHKIIHSQKIFLEQRRQNTDILPFLEQIQAKLNITLRDETIGMGNENILSKPMPYQLCWLVWFFIASLYWFVINLMCGKNVNQTVLLSESKHSVETEWRESMHVTQVC